MEGQGEKRGYERKKESDERLTETERNARLLEINRREIDREK